MKDPFSDAADMPVMSAVEDVFNDPADIQRGFFRNGRKQPLITMPDGKVKAYASPSAFAGTFDDGYGLAVWQGRHLARSIGANEDLAAICAGLEYGDPRLDEIIAAALERAKLHEKANWGTAVHRFIEPDSPPTIPERMVDDVEAFNAEMIRYHLRIVESEITVVNDLFGMAGTLDHLIEDIETGEVGIGDVKTGKVKPMSAAIQVYIYAGSVRYNTMTGERSPLHPRIAPGSDALGYLFHVPRGEKRAKFERIKMDVAENLAKMAAYVRWCNGSRARLLSPM